MAEDSQTIVWTTDKFAQFYKKLYECVHDEGMHDGDTFMFDGHEFVIDYAKYLAEYLRDKFNNV